MKFYSFPRWAEVLEKQRLSDSEKQSYRITIQWYLGDLKKRRQRATVGSARLFIEARIRERKPEEWIVERWREALNWFFKNAKSRTAAEIQKPMTARTVKGEDGSPDGRRAYGVTVREYQERVAPEPLIEEMIRLMRVRHLSYRTEEAYIGWVRRMEAFVAGKKTMEEFGEEDLKAFLSHLAVEEGVSAGTQRQALNAGVFFLRESRQMELGDFSDYVAANPNRYYPVVYSQGEIRRLLDRMEGVWKLMARLQYGCGLRISELCRLRVKDIDLERKKLTIRAGKGDKDRMVPLPRSTIEDLQAYLQDVRTVHDLDSEEGRPGVYLPNALDRKMPKAGESWAWFWAFPMKSLSRDPRNSDGPRRRHHILPKAYQRELSVAAQKADIPKRSNSHALRHSFATHHLENGTNIRTVQQFLGHQTVETTMIYLHVMEDQAEQCVSPLDRV
ncbi:integron integrase [Puniceicoccus vermicola]|nr:integron integrase [Puniceicoccus vermicola]